MARHVDFLGLLFGLWGVFNGLIGIAVLAFGVSAALLAVGRHPGPSGEEVVAGVTAATLVLLAGAALLWAVAHAWCARALRRRRPTGRLLGLVLALFDLLLLPFGTALGAYAFWVLLNEQTRPLFELTIDD